MICSICCKSPPEIKPHVTLENGDICESCWDRVGGRLSPLPEKRVFVSTPNSTNPFYKAMFDERKNTDEV